MGDSADNMYIRGHMLAGSGTLDVDSRRHRGDLSIDSSSTTCTESQWNSIVVSAKSGDTDAEFYDVVYAVWPAWAASNLSTGGQKSLYRNLVLKLVDPQP